MNEKLQHDAMIRGGSNLCPVNERPIDVIFSNHCLQGIERWMDEQLGIFEEQFQAMQTQHSVRRHFRR